MEKVKGTDLVIGEIYVKYVVGYKLPIIFKFIGHHRKDFLYGHFLDACHTPLEHIPFCQDYEREYFLKADQGQIHLFYNHFPELKSNEIGYIW
jgi:hypothetical protein